MKPITKEDIEKAYKIGEQILIDCDAAKHYKNYDYPMELRDSDLKVCCDCYNKQVYARRDADKLRKEYGKQKGREYWKKRGIKIGEKVVAVTSSIFSPASEIEVFGITKVGVNGAYVSSQGEKLDPNYFHKI